MKIKDVIGFALLIIAILCIVNAFIFVSIVNPIYEFAQLWLQMACVGTAWLCFLFGMSIWFSQTAYFRPRQHLRLLMIVSLIGLLVAIVVTCVFYTKAISSMGDYTVLEEVLTGAELAFNTVTIVVCVIVIVLMVISIVLLLYLIFSRRKAHQDDTE